MLREIELVGLRHDVCRERLRTRNVEVVCALRQNFDGYVALFVRRADVCDLLDRIVGVLESAVCLLNELRAVHHRHIEALILVV